MRVSKKNQSKVNFAKFCKNNNFDPQDAIELVILVNYCVRSGINEANIKDYPKHKHEISVKHLEEHCKVMGLRVDSWPGLYPLIKNKDGSTVNLPDL